MAKKDDGVLAQSEIDQLLGAMADEEEKKWETVDDGTGGTRKVKPVEDEVEGFFTARQKKQVESIFTAAARELIEHVSVEVQSLCHFHVASVDELSYQSFIRSIPTPTAIVRADWGEERMIIEVDPFITPYLLHSDTVELLHAERDDFAENSAEFQTIEDVIHNILRGKIHEFSRREMKKLSEVLFEPLLRLCAESFRKTAGTFPLRGAGQRGVEHAEVPGWKLFSLETNPQFANGAPDSEVCLLVSIMAKIQEEEGFINVCLPAPFVREVLVGCGIIEGAGAEKPLSEQNALAVLGGFTLPSGTRLKKGDIIDLPEASLSAITLCGKSGAELAQAELVCVDDHLAVRVTDTGAECRGRIARIEAMLRHADESWHDPAAASPNRGEIFFEQPPETPFIDEAEGAERFQNDVLYFEDIVHFSDYAVQKILRYTANTDLAYALKDCSGAVWNAVLGNMSAFSTQHLRAEFERLGAVKRSDAHTGQLNIMRTAEAMVESDAISLPAALVPLLEARRAQAKAWIDDGDEAGNSHTGTQE